MKLDEFINKNRAEFDTEEPNVEHFQNFANKLTEISDSKKQSKVKLIYPFIGIASSIVLLAALFFLFEIPSKNKVNSAHQMLLSDVSIEYKEAEIFFINDVKTKSTELKKLKCNKIAERQVEIVFKELNQLDIVYTSLQKDLASNEGDQRIIDAMLNNYQTQVEILDAVISELKANC